MVTEVKFLGFVFSIAGIRPDTISTIQNVKKLSNKKKITIIDGYCKLLQRIYSEHLWNNNTLERTIKKILFGLRIMFKKLKDILSNTYIKHFW